MKNIQRIFILLIAILLGAVLADSPVCFAQDYSVEATVNTNKVALGSAITFSLTIYGTETFSEIKLPDIDGFDKKFIGTSSTNISILNSQYISSISFNYSLLPLRTGQLKIPSFNLNISGNSYQTGEIIIEVIDPQSQPSTGAVTQLQDNISLQIQTSKNELYLNEPLIIKVFFLYASGLSIRDPQYPRIEHIGFIDDSFDQTRQYEQVLDGKRFNIIEFRKVIYPTRTGQLTIGPAQMDCNIVVRSPNRTSSLFEEDFFNSMFNRGEKRPVTVTSQPLTVNVLDLPAEGKPENFSGGVGNLNFDASVSPTEVQVGDPVTLKMKVEGQGNLKAVEFPRIKDTEDFKFYDPLIKEEGRAKTFEQVLIPKSENVTEIPVLSFSYFNIETGKYETITQGPFPIKVKKVEQDSGLVVLGLDHQPVLVAPEKIGEGIVFIKDSPGTLKIKGEQLHNSFLYSLVLILMLLGLISGNLWYQMTHKMETDQDFARQRKAYKTARKELKKAKQYIYENRHKEFYDRLFKAYLQYVSHKLSLPAGMVGHGEIRKSLEKHQISRDILNDMDHVFQECEAIRYASGQVNEGQMNISHQRVERIVDYIERKVR
ncbi:MAG: BatD family protein [Candidatus Omnitrophota bacterium]